MISEIISIHPYYEVEVNTYGYGVLTDVLSCTVTQELGGAYELEMTYPVDGARYEYIQLNNIIHCHATPYGSNTGFSGEGDATREPFRIYEISRPINKIVTIKAQHYRYDLSGIIIDPYETTEETTLSEFTSFILTHCHPSNVNNSYFAFVTAKAASDKTGKPISSTVPVSLLSLLGGDDNSIPSAFGVELWFQNKSILIAEKPEIPSGNPKVNIMYGKNMTDFTWSSKSDNMYTAVYPFYYFENSDGVGQLYEIPEKTISTGLSGIPDKWYLLDLSSAWVNDRYNWRDEYPTIEEMREVANNFIAENNLGSPVHSITVSFIDESRINAFANYGYTDLEKCNLGDYVGVTFPDYECYSILRIVKTTYDAIRDQYESVELGEITQSLSSGISANQLSTSSFASGLASSLASEKAISINTHNLTAEVAKIDTLTADDAIITNIAAVAITTDRIEAAVADIGYIKSDEIESEVAKIGYLKADDIESDTGSFHYLDTDVLEAKYATIAGVRAGYADINFANVNVANIDSAKLTEFFSRSGYVQHETVGTEDVQYLRGVKIVGDIIKADTISAKKLIIRNETETGDYTDGLIWQINAQSGELTQQQLTEEQYRKKLDGTDLVAHSVTAREITTEKIQGSTGYIQFGDEVQDDGTIVRGPNLNLNNELIYRNGKLELNLSSLDIKIGNAVNYAIDNVTIGGRNWLVGNQAKPSKWTINYPSVTTVTDSDSTGYRATLKFSSLISGWEIVFSPAITVTPGLEYTLSVDYTVNKAYDLYSGGDHVFGLAVVSKIPGSSNNAGSTVFGTVVFPTTVTAKTRGSVTFTPTTDTIYLVLNGGDITDGQTDISFYIGNIMLEVGNKATDWSPAPEDSITYTDTVASKISSARVVTVSTVSGATLDNIKGWCALGAETNWGSIDEDVSSFQVGDLVYLKRKCSNFNNAYVYCKGNVKQVVDAHRLILSMLGFEAPMPTSNPIAYINATGETVKIEAKHVDITGAVTFSSFEDDLKADYNAISNNASTALTNAAAAQSTANSASTAASNAQSTANSASTAASNAQSTANSASTAASNAQSTANSASTAASNAQTAANNANTAVNNVANTTVRRYKQTVDLSGSQYNVNTYYPAISNDAMNRGPLNEVSCVVQLDSNVPSWATHSNGFTVNVTAKYKYYGWGTTDGTQYCTENKYSFCDRQPAFACEQNMYNSKPIFMLRGGGRYYMYTEFYTSGWTVYTSQTNSYGSSNYQWYVAPVSNPLTSMSGNRSGLLKLTRDVDVLAWCRAEDVTKIDGGTIYTNSIKANSIDVTDLFAQKITANGSITSIDKSNNEYMSFTLGYLSSQVTYDSTIFELVGHADYIALSGNMAGNSSLKGDYSVLTRSGLAIGNADQLYSQTPSIKGITTKYDVKATGGFFSDDTMSIKPQISNEVNFGGTNTSSTIYFGYRATDSRPKPTEYIFGTGSGTATVKANEFLEGGTSLSSKYQAKGSYLASGGSIASGNGAGVTGGAIYSWLRSTNNRTRQNSEASSTVSCASGSTVNLHSITLGAGLYVLTGTATLNAGSGSSNGRTWLQIATSSGGGGMDRYSRVIQIGAAAQQQQLQVTKIVAPSSNATYYLVGGHNTGPQRSFAAMGFEALKIF